MYREELKSSKCREEVHRRMKRAGRDIRFDDVLANACHEDRAHFCADVQPVRRVVQRICFPVRVRGAGRGGGMLGVCNYSTE